MRIWSNAGIRRNHKRKLSTIRIVDCNSKSKLAGRSRFEWQEREPEDHMGISNRLRKNFGMRREWKICHTEMLWCMAIIWILLGAELMNSLG